MSPLSPISRKTILFLFFRFPISFFKIGDNGDKIRKKVPISLISGLFSIFMFQTFRGHGDKPGDSGDKWQILELSDTIIYFLVILFHDFGDTGTTGTNGKLWKVSPKVFVCPLGNREEKCRKARIYRLSEDFGRISHLSPLSPNLSPRGVWGQERGHVKSL